MKINTIYTIKQPYAVFKSGRLDRAAVLQLQNGTVPLLENNKKNIAAAIQNLGRNGSRSSIEFLLDTAENLEYGGCGCAEFKSILDKDGITSEPRENTQWDILLQDALKNALSARNDEAGSDFSDLNERFQKVVSADKPLSAEQKKLLKLRKKLSEALTAPDILKDDEDVKISAEALKNLDYFTASSEIPLQQKIECLERLIKFMSSKYKINPQLQDKKLQAAGEILNDIIIKPPEKSDYHMKSADQRMSAICAAISICRKLTAYEDKKGFIDLIMEELKNSPNMSVFDITELGSGKKIQIPKINIDYKTALKKGYRIIDASAHIWMNNAHTLSSAVPQEKYIPFDEEHWGVYDDSSWYLGLDDEFAEEKQLLDILIKEESFIKSVNERKKPVNALKHNFKSFENEILHLKFSAYKALNKELRLIFPEKSTAEISKLIRELISFYSVKSRDNQVNISEKMPDGLKERLTEEFIFNSVPDADEAQRAAVKMSIKNISGAVFGIISADKKNSRLKSINTGKSRYLYFRDLYKAAAAHRLAAESDINTAEGAVRFEMLSKIPPRSTQIIDYLNAELRKTGNPDVSRDIIKIESIIPAEINSIISVLTGRTYGSIIKELAARKKNDIEQGGWKAAADAAARLGIRQKDKTRIFEKLDNIAAKADTNPKGAELNEILRELDCTDEIHFAGFILNSFERRMKKGLSESELNRFEKIFGSRSRIKPEINSRIKQLKRLFEEYTGIVNKYNIPSSRELIIRQLEKNGFILTREKLDRLKECFENKESRLAENELISNMHERSRADSSIYKFRENEEEIFNSIEKNLPVMKKYCSRRYDNLNKILSEPLKELYSKIGMHKGIFFVPEEGSSGLSAGETIRILEQMTGKACRIERDIIEASRQIKKGQGSGIISMSLDESGFLFHSQYIPAVTEETVSAEDGTLVKKDILWTDNSWGASEREHFWEGSDGFKYTDYDRDYGPAAGFLLSDDLKIGIPVDYIFASKGIEKETNTDFSLFSEVILQGMPSDAKSKIKEIFESIFNLNDSSSELEALEDELLRGGKIDTERLSKIDINAEKRRRILYERIKKEIKSREDFEKLDCSDMIRFEFEKIALYLSADKSETVQTALQASDMKSLKEAGQIIRAAQLDKMAAIIGKSPDCLDNLYAAGIKQLENLYDEIELQCGVPLDDKQRTCLSSEIFLEGSLPLDYSGDIDELERILMNKIHSAAKKIIRKRKASEYFIKQAEKIVKDAFDKEIRISSLESNALKNNPLREEFSAAADKYLNPKSDEEFLKMIKELQHASFEKAYEFLDRLADEETGLKIRDAYDYLRLFLADDTSISNALNEALAAEETKAACSSIGALPNGNPAEALYRSLYIKLADMEAYKNIAAQTIDFKKSKLRSAFPHPSVIQDSALSETASQILSAVKNTVLSISEQSSKADFLRKYDEIYREYLSKSEFYPLLTGSAIDKTAAGAETLQKFARKLQDLSDGIKHDNELKTAAKSLADIFNHPENTAADLKAPDYAAVIMSKYDEAAAQGLTVQKTKEAVKAGAVKLKNNINAAVYADTAPRYRNEALRMLKKLINLYRKNAPEGEISRYEKNFISFFTEKHIVKSPIELLNEYVKLLQSGRAQTDTADALRHFLMQALKTAEYAKIQYQLTECRNEGISSKIKSMMPFYTIRAQNGSEFSMTDREGILYLIEKLENYNDNNTVLKLFLAQTGLAQSAVNAMISCFESNTVLESLLMELKDTARDIKCINTAEIEAEKFFKQSRIEYKSVHDAVKQFERYLKNRLGRDIDMRIYKTFFDYLNNAAKNCGKYSGSASLYKKILEDLCSDAFRCTASCINERIDYIYKSSEYLKQKKALINAAELPENSPEYKHRKSFNEYFDKIFELLEKQSAELFLIQE